MDEYISRNELLKAVQSNVAEAHNERCAQLLEAILNVPTADVVPKSEVSILTVQNMALEKAKYELQHELNMYKGVENILKDNMGELIMAAIAGAKQEVAREICCEIEEEIVAALESNYRALKEWYDGRCNDYILEMVGRINGKIDALRGIEGFVEELKKKYTEGDQ